MISNYSFLLIYELVLKPNRNDLMLPKLNKNLTKLSSSKDIFSL